MTDGWVKLHRKILKWEWYQDNDVKSLFLHLVLIANHEPARWQGIEVGRGEIITGRKRLSKDTGLSERTIRTCLKKLISTSELTIKATNKYSIITICNYDSYNNSDFKNDQQNDQQNANKRPASDQQVTTNKNDKNDKKLNTFCPTSDEVRLSELLLSLILERKPDYKKPNIQNWANHIDLMIRIDCRKPESIERVIRWAQADMFWQNNILSTDKLRKQFDKLELKASGSNNRQNLGMEHSAFGKEYLNE